MANFVSVKVFTEIGKFQKMIYQGIMYIGFADFHLFFIKRDKFRNI